MTRIRQNKAGMSSVVDGVCTPDGIADSFASKYGHLYTNVAYNVDDMKRVIESTILYYARWQHKNKKHSSYLL